MEDSRQLGHVPPKLNLHTKLAAGRLDRSDGDVHEDGALLFPRKDLDRNFVATARLKASYYVNPPDAGT